MLEIRTSLKVDSRDVSQNKEGLQIKLNAGFSQSHKLQTQLNILMVYAFAKNQKIFTAFFLFTCIFKSKPVQRSGVFQEFRFEIFFSPPPLLLPLNESQLQNEAWCSQIRSSPHTKAHHFIARISITASEHSQLQVRSTPGCASQWVYRSHAKAPPH